MILVDLVLGPLISSVLLWLIGKKMQYDFMFWKLLVITISSSLAGLIPFGGVYVSMAVFIGLFCWLERMPSSEILWVALIAFAMKWVIVIVLMLSLKSVMVHLSEDGAPWYGFLSGDSKELAPERRPAEGKPQAVAEFEAIASSNGVKSGERIYELDLVELPDHLKDKYRISGIALRNKERVAMINGRVVRPGDLLDGRYSIYKIADDYIELISDDQRYILRRDVGLRAE